MKRPSGATKSDKNRTVKSATSGDGKRSRQDQETVAVFTQLGGGQGNYAGDAAILLPTGSGRAFLVDGGSQAVKAPSRLFESLQTHVKPQKDESDFEDEIEEAKDENGDNRKAGKARSRDEIEEAEDKNGDKQKARKTDPRIIGLETHNHSDHTFSPRILKLMDKVWFGESGLGVGVVPDGVTDEQVTPDPSGQRPELFRWRLKSPVSRGVQQGRLELAGRAVHPADWEHRKKKENDENETSLGVFLTFEWRSEAGGNEIIHRMASLGDMTDRAVVSVETGMEDLGDEPMDVVKLAHHGSIKNFSAIPAGLIGESTRVVMSGVTVVPANDLLKNLRKIGADPKKVYILLDDATEIGVKKAWQGSNTQANNLREAGVTIARDFKVIYGRDSTVTYEIVKADGKQEPIV